MGGLKEYNGRKKAIGKISEAGGQGIGEAREWFSSELRKKSMTESRAICCSDMAMCNLGVP